MGTIKTLVVVQWCFRVMLLLPHKQSLVEYGVDTGLHTNPSATNFNFGMPSTHKMKGKLATADLTYGQRPLSFLSFTTKFKSKGRIEKSIDVDVLLFQVMD